MEQTQEQKAYATVVYEMKDGTEQPQPVYNERELEYELASAKNEERDPKSYVKGYRVE